MTDALQRLADLSLVVFVVTSMLSMGMSQPLADVIAPLRRPLSVVLALTVNFVLSPLLALGLTWLVPLHPQHATGLLLLSTAAGAPFLPKLAEIAGGSLAASVALTMLLTAVSIIFIPLALPLLVPGLQADAWAIARPLLFFMLIPLGIGFALARARVSWMERVLGFIRSLSNLALILLLVLLLGLNLNIVLGAIGSFAVAIYTAYLLALMGAAWLIGGADRPARKVFVLGAGCRNIAAALVVAGTNLDHPAVTVMLIVAAIVSLVVLLVLVRAMQRATT